MQNNDQETKRLTNLLEEALILSATHHKGQTDRITFPYIFHPIRVMNRIWQQDADNFKAMIAALLHDVVEDTDCTIEGLKRIFDEDIVAAVDLLTKRDGSDIPQETYEEYIERLASSKNKIAITVKLADLSDNLDPHRIKDIDGKPHKKREKYLAAQERLTKVLSSIMPSGK